LPDRLVELLPEKMDFAHSAQVAENQLVETLPVDLHALVFDPSTLDSLLAAIETHSVTQANQQLEALRKKGGDEEKLASTLRPFFQNYDMEGAKEWVLQLQKKEGRT